MPFDDDAYRHEVGVPELRGEPGYTPLERLTARPTLEVSQIEGGGRYTVIPAVARAYLTCRLVPDQDPARVAAAIARHVIHHCPPGVTVSVEEVPGGIPAYAIRRDHPALEAAEEALRAVYPGPPRPSHPRRRHAARPQSSCAALSGSTRCSSRSRAPTRASTAPTSSSG